MVSDRQPADPWPFSSLLDWFAILFSCFGQTHRVKAPPVQGDSDPRLLLAIDSSEARSRSRESFHESIDSPRLCDFGPPSVFNNAHQILLRGDGDDENEDCEDMFCGEFLLGSKILTEVEMESPVEEGKALATPVRTSKRSLERIFLPSHGELLSESSHSSTVDVRKSHGSSYSSLTSDSPVDFAQLCPIQTDLMRSSNEKPVMSSSRNAEPSPFTPTSALSLHAEGLHCLLRDAHKRSGQSEIPCSASQSQKSDKGRSLFSFSYDTGNQQLPSDHDYLPIVEKSSLVLQGKHSNTGLSRKHHHQTAAEFSAFDCNTGIVLCNEEEKITRHCNWRECEGRADLDKEKNYVTVGSLPDCLPSGFLYAQSLKKIGHRQIRARSLTDQDFAELKGCIDLGFVFPPDHVPDLCETLPALEVCYAVAHGAISPGKNTENYMPLSPSSPPISPWKIASPGDQPQQVKARLRHWAQAVALNVWQPC